MCLFLLWSLSLKTLWRRIYLYFWGYPPEDLTFRKGKNIQDKRHVSQFRGHIKESQTYFLISTSKKKIVKWFKSSKPLFFFMDKDINLTKACPRMMHCMTSLSSAGNALANVHLMEVKLWSLTDVWNISVVKWDQWSHKVWFINLVLSK